MKNNTTLKQKIILAAFGFFLSVLLLEIGLRFAGFIYLSLQETKNIVSLSHKGAYRILCLGESTTAEGGKDSYPPQLEQILNQRLLHRSFSVINKGVPAINTTGILSQLKYNLDKYQPDMVIVMMGINDQEGRFLRENARSRVKSLIRALRIYKLAKLLRERIWQVANLKDIYLELGQYYQVRNDNSRAEEMFKKSLELSPKDVKSYIRLGSCYTVQGKFAQAEEIFQKAIALAPDNDEVYIELGWCYSDEGKIAQAEETFKKAIEVNPKLYIGYSELGLYYQCQHNYPQAEEMFQKAIETTPHKETAYAELGNCYHTQGKFTQAEEMFKKVIALTPEKGAGYIGLGWCYQGQKKLLKLRRCSKKP